MSIESLQVNADSEDGEITLEVPQQNPLVDWDENAELQVVGQPCNRLDGIEKVTGSACYTSDVRLPGQLYAAVLRCPYPHADVVSVDLAEAEALPGVRAAISAADQADIKWYQEEVPLFADRARFVGDEVAAVAADTPEIAADALRLIRVEYRQRPCAMTMDAALAEDAESLHGDGNRVDAPDIYTRGDVATGWQRANVRVEQTYTTQTALHNCLEPHGTTAVWSGPNLTLYESTQGVFAVRKLIAQKLGLPAHRVRVISEYIGGGFGAKQTLWKQAVFAALLAKKSDAPVQLMLDREGENLATGNRNPSRQRVALGATSDGVLTVIEASTMISIGAYSTAGEASNMAGLYQHLYRCENVRTEQLQVYTNTGPAAAFRAPGYVEAAFALESAMDELAAELKLDPLLLRRKNYTGKDQTKGKPWSSPQGLEACYARLDEVFGWSSYCKPRVQGAVRRGIGLAAHEWMAGMGSPPAYVWIKLNEDATADVITGSQDIGTGTRTVLAQIAAEGLGLPLANVRLHLGDTATGPVAPVSQGSFTVPTLAPAIRTAAENVRDQLCQCAALLLNTEAAALRLADGKVFQRGKQAAALDLAEVTRKLAPHILQGHGGRNANDPATSIRPFGAQAAEVAVDTSTGEISVLRIVSAPDCGRLVNPKLANSQVIGGVTQGIGFSLLEERVVDERLGLVLNADLEEYKIATIADVPEITHAEVNLPDLNANPSGSKGLGELPLIPAAPAIINAIYDATGLRFRDLPVTRARVLAALAEQASANNRGNL